MWTNVKKQGYLCAYPTGGYATPLLGQLAEAGEARWATVPTRRTPSPHAVS